MTMGERIRQARLDAGLSQRQLAGDVMTRNMLSALEHNGANPSMATLRYLSEKLCKPISYFLGEELPKVPEAEEMARARSAFQAGEYRACLKELEGLDGADFMQERKLMEALADMELARQAIGEERLPYACELLQRSREAGEETFYFTPQLRRVWLTLAAQAAQKPSERAALVGKISGDDEVLSLKADAAIADGNLEKAERLLEAMENRGGEWNWLRGEVHFARKEYAQAAKCYHRVEKLRAGQTRQRLEICYREMGDYKMAYYYATLK